MKKIALTLAVMAAALVPAAALADDAAPTPSTVASQICKAEQVSMGAATFAKTYGTNASAANAFGKCVSKNNATAQADVSNAAKTCKAERAADAAAFTKKYGTSKGSPSGKGAGANAFGKCVSAHAKTSATTEATTTTSASASCKAAAKDAAAFATKYGTGSNAFGKCVAASKK